MSKKNIIKKTEPSMTTYERLTKDPVRRAKIERGYKDLVLSELLIALMEEDHVSVRKLAQAAGISPSIIQDVRSGKKENMTVKSFSSIATALGYEVVLQKISHAHHK
jgi:DNA-binding Xre family transcriptional regulator